MSPSRSPFPSFCIAACLALAACATPQAETPPANAPMVRGALSGVRQQLNSFYNVNPDCTTGGYPTLKLAKAPQHGQVSVEQGMAFADYPKDNIRSACNGRSVPATLIYYMSEPGYVGADSVAFDRIGVSGGYGYHDYMINVR